MDRLTKLVAALAIGLGSFAAHAGYAQLAPPERFGGAYPNFTFAPSANDAKYGRVVIQPNALKVPGTNVTMPAAYRFAANAPRFAAAAIYLSPHLRFAVGIASLLGVANIFWDEAEKAWKTTQKGQDNIVPDTYYAVNSFIGVKFDSASAACDAVAGASTNGAAYGKLFDNGNSCGIFRIKDNVFLRSEPIAKVTAPCPAGWTKSPAGCLSPEYGKVIKIEDEADFARRILNPELQPGWPNVPADWPLPETIPQELPPGTPLPVDEPVINPTPGPNPIPQPKFIPTGDPVPNPTYDPQKAPGPANEPYFQPGIRVTPRPVPGAPWQVDITPVNRPQSSPDPQPETVDEPAPGDQTKAEDLQSLCEKHPDIVACAKMDEVKPETVKNENKTISITPKTGWGAENASCPAPKIINVAGVQAEFSYQPICDLAKGLRPIVIALAWLSAATMVITAARRSS